MQKYIRTDEERKNDVETYMLTGFCGQIPHDIALNIMHTFKKDEKIINEHLSKILKNKKISINDIKGKFYNAFYSIENLLNYKYFIEDNFPNDIEMCYEEKACYYHIRCNLIDSSLIYIILKENEDEELLTFKNNDDSDNENIIVEIEECKVHIQPNYNDIVLHILKHYDF